MDQFVNLTVAGLSLGAIYSAFALALVLIWRATRVVNFAQGAMAVAAGYVSVYITEHTGSYWLGVLSVVVAGFIFGVIVESAVMRWVSDRAPANAVIVAVGVTLVIQAILGIFYGPDFVPMDRAFSDSKLVVGDMALFSPFDIYTLVGVVIIVGGLGLFFGRTRMGLRLRSSAFAPEVSRLLGVNVQRMRTLGWGLAAAVGGLTTLFVVPRNVGLTPNVMDGVFISSFTAAVIGGLDSPEGAVIGGLLTGLTLAYVTGYVPAGASLGNVAVMLLLLVVLLVRPGGLFSGVAARRV